MAKNQVAMMVDPNGEMISKIEHIALVDAILAKKNLGTTIDMAPITIGLGPGFCAGKDVHVVVETMRGHNLGRLIYQGHALPNTGVPGNIKGYSKERVNHVEDVLTLGDTVKVVCLGKDKMEAISIAHKTSLPSIISSRLSFFAATFGVACYSQVEMIGSICTLLARGAIISMVVVLLVLPAMFMIFDKLICKTSIGFLGKKAKAQTSEAK